MHPFLNLFIGKQPLKVVPFPLCSLLAGNAFATLTRPWRLLTQKMCQFMVVLVLVLSTAFLPSIVQAQTFKAMPLDGGGHTSGFAQADNGRLYAYGDVFGAWRSDDGGSNWSYLNWSIDGGDIVGLGMAVQKNNADVVFYSTSNALYKSTNGGANWTKLLSDLAWGDQADEFKRMRGTSQILIRSDNPNEIWYAGPRKNLTGWLWKSSNGGTDWVKAGSTNFDSNKTRTLHNVSAYSNQIWVGAENGLYVSTDGGSNFSLVGGSGRLSKVGMISRFTSGTFAGVGLVTRASINNDGGGISRIVASNYNDASTYTITDAARENIYFGYPTGLQIFSDGSSSAWNTGGDRHGFSPAGNGGQTFTVRATTLNTDVVPIWTTAAQMVSKNHPDYGTDQVIEDVTNPNKWIITGGGAAMYSLDKGFSWQYFPNGTGIAAVKTYRSNVSRYDVNRMYVPASDIGSVIVTDGGSSGQATLSSNKSVNQLHNALHVMEGPNTQNLVLAGNSQNANTNIILKTSDGGSNWNLLDLSSSGLPLSRDGITKSVMSLTDANDFIVTLASGTDQSGQITPGTINPGVWRTTNGGGNFSKVNGLPSNISTGARYSPQSAFLERDAVLTNVRYFTARYEGNSPTASAGFFRSTDGGSNWSFVNHPSGAGAWIWGFAADPIRSNNLWAATDWGGVKFSRDGGDTWNPTAQYFDSRHVSSCDGKIAVWGKANGGSNPYLLWYSADDGATWTAQSTVEKNFHNVQGITVDRNGKIWVSWNSITVVTPVVGTTTADTQAPTAPMGLSSSNIASNSFTLNWTASTDNVGVSGYDVYNGTTLVGSTTSATTINVASLTASTAYSMTVKAKDAAGNVSVASANFSVTTSAATVTANLGFENDFTSWSTYGTASINTADVRSGAKSGYFTNGGGNYVMTGLTPGATYSVKAWVKAVSGTDIWITVNSYGGNQTGAKMTSSSWTQSGDIVFTMGASNTSATLSAWTGSGSSAYFDDYTIAPFTASTTTADRTDPVGTGTITAKGENGTNEGNAKAFDNDSNTKWLDFSSQSWIQFTFASSAKHAVSKYTITSANDADGRDPRDWKLYGTNVANPSATSDFALVDSRNNVTFGSRFQKLEFTPSSSSTAYSTYRLEITANKSASTSTPVSIIQLAEIELFAPATCTNCRAASVELGSKPQTEILTLKLQPNPANQEVTISLAGFEEESAVQVKMSDMTGKPFMGQQVQIRKGVNQVTLPVSHLPQGLFVVTVQGGKTAKTAKLVITK